MPVLGGDWLFSLGNDWHLLLMLLLDEAQGAWR